jgi:hypothetical protein
MNFAAMIWRPELVVLLVLTLWLLIVTILFIRFYTSYLRISKNSDKKSLLAILDNVLQEEKENKKAIDQLGAQYATLKDEVSFHVQKVGLVRYNPFDDTGGDQSFILALVDAHNSGVIVSSYHTRSGTRLYAKNVEKGKSLDHELTAEEQKALKSAKRVN